MQNNYFDDVCENLSAFCKKNPYFCDYEVTTRTSRDGTEYKVFKIDVKMDGEFKGTIFVSSYKREYYYNGDIKQQDILSMRLDQWKVFRNHRFWKFDAYVNPRYVGSYIECFLDLECRGQVYWMETMLERTRFFDNKCSYNPHQVLSLKNEMGAITIDLELTLNDKKVPCTLKIFMTGKRKHYVNLELWYDDEKVNVFNGQFPAWLVRKKVNRFLRDREMMSRLQELL